MTSFSNLQGALWAEAAVIAFRHANPCDYEDSLGDLLTDLMHWANVRGSDFDAALARARSHYEAEVQS